jgi:predicted PurR-regulated permease PerM
MNILFEFVTGTPKEETVDRVCRVRRAAVRSKKCEPNMPDTTARRALTLITTATVFAILLFVVWQTSAILLLVFAGILLAVVLNGLAVRISGRFHTSYRVSVTVVLLTAIAVLAIGALILAPRLSDQVSDMSERLPQALQQLRDKLGQYGWARQALSQGSGSASMPFSNGLLPRLPNLFSSTFGFLADAVLVLFIGLYLAYDPGLYRSGLIRMVAPRHRSRATEVLDVLNGTLWWWAIARLCTMLAVAVLTGIGLALIGVPLAFTLGLIAGLFDFVPFIGPILGAVPGIVLALTESADKALYAFILYIGIQQLEGNVITPLFEKKAVGLPPAVTLAALALFGALGGILGMFLAEPLAAVLMVLVNKLYLEDWLGDRGGGSPPQ